jgi:hypothetical protein
MKLAVYFENKYYTMSVVSWGFLTNHARVLLCVARDPGVRLRDIASSLGITERSAHRFVTDLTAAGYLVKQKDDRRNRYQIQAHMPLLEPASQPGTCDRRSPRSPRRHATRPSPDNAGE